MRIATKFNLVILSVMLLAMGGTGYFSYFILQQNAKQEVLAHAKMMLESAKAIRSYTITEIKPLLNKQMRHEFLPETVPAYAATTTFSKLRKEYNAYSYKEATLNPTNQRNRPTDWEADIIQEFRKNP